MTTESVVVAKKLVLLAEQLSLPLQPGTVEAEFKRAVGSSSEANNLMLDPNLKSLDEVTKVVAGKLDEKSNKQELSQKPGLSREPDEDVVAFIKRIKNHVLEYVDRSLQTNEKDNPEVSMWYFGYLTK